MGRGYGYAGRILRVDLSSENISDLPTSGYTDAFIGGRGIAARIYRDEVPPHAGAFDPENRLIFTAGPLAGVAGTAGSRWQVCGRSPATNPEVFCYANSGGRRGAKLKSAGCDGIVVQGEAEKPVYLLVDEGKAELRDASHLWGKGAVEVRETIKGDLGRSTGVVATGIAGENTAYDPRMYVTNSLLYAMEPRQPIQQLHEIFNPVLSWLLWTYKLEGTHASGEVIRAMARRFWGSEEAADFSTYEGKALAARKIQDRQYAYECMILCNFAWPMMLVDNTDDHVGDPAVAGTVFSAVTGRNVDEEGLNEIGERVFNLQRAILTREGHGGRESDNLPDIFYSL